MSWHLEPDRPIYLQLAEELRRRIIAGVYPPGERMPAVRELAAEASVNPNTMQRAMADLENQGLVFTHRTVGRSVTDDEKAIKQARDMAAEDIVAEFLEKMHLIGFGSGAAIDYLSKRIKEEQGNE